MPSGVPTFHLKKNVQAERENFLAHRLRMHTQECICTIVCETLKATYFIEGYKIPHRAFPEMLRSKQEKKMCWKLLLLSVFFFLPSNFNILKVKNRENGIFTLSVVLCCILCTHFWNRLSRNVVLC